MPRKLQEALSFADADDIEQHGTISEVSLRRSIDLEDRRLNLTVTQGDQWKIDLNYHYSVPEDKQPGANAAKLLENTYAPNRNHGLELLETIYDLVLEEGTAA